MVNFEVRFAHIMDCEGLVGTSSRGKSAGNGAVDEEAYVYLNGQHAYEHSCASAGLTPDELWLTPFAFDAKPYLRFGQKNAVAVRVYSTDGMGGIYLPVYLIGADRELDAELMKAMVRQRSD